MKSVTLSYIAARFPLQSPECGTLVHSYMYELVIPDGDKNFIGPDGYIRIIRANIPGPGSYQQMGYLNPACLDCERFNMTPKDQRILAAVEGVIPNLVERFDRQIEAYTNGRPDPHCVYKARNLALLL